MVITYENTTKYFPTKFLKGLEKKLEAKLTHISSKKTDMAFPDHGLIG
jgi:hypothetical protein